MSDFYGDDADYRFLHPTPDIVKRMCAVMWDLRPGRGIKRVSNEAPSQKLSSHDAGNAVADWLWGSYADEVLDAKAGEESFFAGYFVFTDKNVMSLLICFRNDCSGGAIFFGMDIARVSETMYRIWKPDLNHSLQEIDQEAASIRKSIADGSWKDPCCKESSRRQLLLRRTPRTVVLQST